MESSRCKSFALMMPQMAIYGEGHIYFSGGNFPKPELNMQPFYIFHIFFNETFYSRGSAAKCRFCLVMGQRCLCVGQYIYVCLLCWGRALGLTVAHWLTMHFIYQKCPCSQTQPLQCSWQAANSYALAGVFPKHVKKRENTTESCTCCAQFCKSFIIYRHE